MVYAADPSEWNGNLAAKAGIVGRIQRFRKPVGAASAL